METHLVVLGILQVVTVLIYGWVGRVFLSQPRYNHPSIFHSPAARLVLCYGPLVAMVVLVVLAFVLTESPWLFLGLTVAGFVASSVRPDRDLLR